MSIVNDKIRAALNGQYVRKFGLNDAVTHFDDSIIWPEDTATYPWPDNAELCTVESDNASDIGISLIISGIDEEGFHQTEDITLTSQSVMTLKKFFRVYRIAVTSIDSNVGKISVSHGSDILAVAPAGLSQTQQLIYTIPINKIFILSQFVFSTSINKDAEFQVWMRQPNRPFALKANFFLQNSSSWIPFEPHIKISELTDIYVSVRSSQKGRVSAEMFGYLYDSNYNHDYPGMEPY